MDREQHITQDAAEHYAVYMMAKAAEDLGIATRPHSEEHWNGFIEYLAASPREWGIQEFAKHYPQYRVNVDAQVPRFVARLQRKFPESTFEFAIDEAAFRNLGLKADFTVAISTEEEPHFVSLKNYVGSGGIERPQVSSGTFLSFSAGFVFERNGVGTYVDPRTGGSFSGSNKADRDAVLQHEGRSALVDLLQVLDDLQKHARSQLLCLRFYDATTVRSVIAQIVPEAQDAMLSIFQILGLDTVRTKFLERAGLDGTEEVLYFDQRKFLDSITNPKYAALRTVVNDPETLFNITPVGQSLRFEFTARDGRPVLSVDVPLTINTNGAWYRPRKHYLGTVTKMDKGHPVELAWGEIRPYKSRELATSTNTYINLRAAGIFAD